MKHRNILIIISAFTVLTFAILSISYGYWTDHLEIRGEASFKMSLPVKNDIVKPGDADPEALDLQDAGVADRFMGLEDTSGSEALKVPKKVITDPPSKDMKEESVVCPIEDTEENNIIPDNTAEDETEDPRTDESTELQ